MRRLHNEDAIAVAASHPMPREQQHKLQFNPIKLLLLKIVVDVFYPSAGSAFEHAVAHFAEHVVEHLAERQATTRGANTVLRLGKGALAIIPMIGAAFALYLVAHDFHRAKEEWSISQAESSENGNSNNMAGFLLFLGAGVADLADACLHLWISYMILSHVNLHLDWVEECSAECVLMSVVCMAIGEIASFRFQQYIHDAVLEAHSRQKQQQQEQRKQEHQERPAST